MREIKFRAWDEINKKMWYSNEVGESLGEWTFQLYFDDGGILRAIIYREIDVGFVQKDCQEHQLPSMIFTGLPDKNGKEIYEGDIVRVNYTVRYSAPDKEDEEHISIAPVYWNNFRSSFALEFSKFANDDLFRFVRDKYAEVIGNIYENPELLEGGKHEL